MSSQIVNITCPGCGARVRFNTDVCEYCKGPIIISSFNSVAKMSLTQVNQYTSSYKKDLGVNPNDKSLNTSIAMCYLRLKLYDEALLAFEKAIENNFDNSESFFYAAVCVLKGQKAFLAKRQDIDKIEKLVKAAIAIEPRGIYYYFWGYIKFDYFSRKFLNTSPSYKECLSDAEIKGISEFDKEFLFELLNVNRPAGF